MPVCEHLSAEELQLYLLDRVSGRRSVRIAEHLVSCAPCLDTAAAVEDRINCLREALARVQPAQLVPVSTSGVLVRKMAPIRVAQPDRRAHYAIAAGLALTASVGSLLLQQRSHEVADLSSKPTARLAIVPPVAVQDSDDDDFELMPEETTPAVKVGSGRSSGKTERRFARRFVEPPRSNRIQQARFVPPPATVMAVAFPASQFHTLDLAPRPTQLAGPPAVPEKPNKFRRFLGVLAKPFKADRT